MLKYKWVATVVLGVFIAASGLAVENKGAENIQIESGSKGTVPFPHRSHQERLGDCNICHTLFPQEPGSLTRLKKSGQLRSKRVMNSLCVNCHKAEQKAGNKTGPTTCSKCHIRSDG